MINLQPRTNRLDFGTDVDTGWILPICQDCAIDLDQFSKMLWVNQIKIGFKNTFCSTHVILHM